MKEVIKNYFLKFSALIMRWPMFHGEPVIAPFECQVFFQSLIKQHMLVFEISVKSFNKGFRRIGALLSKPERMFKTDEDG